MNRKDSTRRARDCRSASPVWTWAGAAKLSAWAGDFPISIPGANVGYLIPRLFNRDDLSLRINGLVDRSRDVLTFTADRKEASVSVEKRFSASTLLIGQYSFRRVEALDISSKISAQEIPLLSQPALVGMLGGSFVEDHRDDPSDATRGAYTLVNAGVSWRDFGSQANFLRFTGQNSTYYTLSSHLVFARKTQFGVVSPYGALYRITVPASNGQPAEVILTDSIPLPERFFMGGSESMRGFSINQAGPRDPVHRVSHRGQRALLQLVRIANVLCAAAHGGGAFRGCRECLLHHSPNAACSSSIRARLRISITPARRWG